MRYRPEMLDEEFIVRNVEMDVTVACVQRHWKEDPDGSGRLSLAGCTVWSEKGRIATITVPDPLAEAAVVAASYEEY